MAPARIRAAVSAGGWHCLTVDDAAERYLASPAPGLTAQRAVQIHLERKTRCSLRAPATSECSTLGLSSLRPAGTGLTEPFANISRWDS